MINSINEYIDLKGKSPYAEWLDAIRDKKTKAKIILRVDRMALNHFGDVESVGEGVFELRFHFGAGYRIYYAREEKHVFLLLCRGDKSTQARDIKLAKQYWVDFKRSSRNDQ